MILQAAAWRAQQQVVATDAAAVEAGSDREPEGLDLDPAYAGEGSQGTQVSNSAGFPWLWL